MSDQIEQIKLRLIEDGIRSLEQHENRLERRLGGIEGFNLCRSLHGLEDFERVLRERLRAEDRLRNASRSGQIALEDYWSHRWGTLQIEFVFKRLRSRQ